MQEPACQPLPDLLINGVSEELTRVTAHLPRYSACDEGNQCHFKVRLGQQAWPSKVGVGCILAADEVSGKAAEPSQLQREAEALGVPVRSRGWAVEALLAGALPADFQRRPADDASGSAAAGVDVRCEWSGMVHPLPG